MNELTYEERLQSQIDQYAETVNIHDLPEIFHIWSRNYISPGMKEVFGTTSIDEAYANALTDTRGVSSDPSRILSIGCGDGSVEIRIAKILIDRGLRDFTFVCADVSPLLLDRLKIAAESAGLAHHMQPVVADLNRIQLDSDFDMIMANHSLHHIEGLEGLFSYCRQHLKLGGIFATCDIIGRNGHMRWPEAAEVLKAIWPTLKPLQRYQWQLKRYNEVFTDFDCSGEGFEGIRAQDVLPTLLQEFRPFKFMAAGGFVDMLVDRGYGPGFKVDDQGDVALIRCLADLNEIMLDTGAMRPTWMMGYFTVDDRGEIYYRNRRACDAARRFDDSTWPRLSVSPGPI